MGGSKQQSNQIKLLVWMDGTITVNTSDASAPLLVFLQGLRGVKHEARMANQLQGLKSCSNCHLK